MSGVPAVIQSSFIAPLFIFLLVYYTLKLK